eukprot:3278497-Lingulodinium_polyedra.AAC.1
MAFASACGTVPSGAHTAPIATTAEATMQPLAGSSRKTRRTQALEQQPSLARPPSLQKPHRRPSSRGSWQWSRSAVSAIQNAPHRRSRAA